jgi:hypothetical protein
MERKKKFSYQIFARYNVRNSVANSDAIGWRSVRGLTELGPAHFGTNFEISTIIHYTKMMHSIQ